MMDKVQNPVIPSVLSRFWDLPSSNSNGELTPNLTSILILSSNIHLRLQIVEGLDLLLLPLAYLLTYQSHKFQCVEVEDVIEW
jgi:hypothetical protein